MSLAASARNPKQKFVPVLCQTLFVLNNNVAIYIKPVPLVESLYCGVGGRWNYGE